MNEHIQGKTILSEKISYNSRRGDGPKKTSICLLSPLENENLIGLAAMKDILLNLCIHSYQIYIKRLGPVMMTEKLDFIPRQPSLIPKK